MEKESQEQLRLIEEMISQTKTKISDSSIFYLLWGWLVLIAASINYYLLNFTNYEYHFIAWPILMTLGGILSGIIGARKGKDRKVQTFIGRALSYLWGAFTVTLILSLFSMPMIGPEGVYPFIILLYGLGTFISGGLLKFSPLIWGGVVSWILGVVAIYVSFSDQLLLIIGAILFSYILPGYLLSKSNKNV